MLVRRAQRRHDPDIPRTGRPGPLEAAARGAGTARRRVRGRQGGRKGRCGADGRGPCEGTLRRRGEPRGAGTAERSRDSGKLHGRRAPHHQPRRRRHLSRGAALRRGADRRGVPAADRRVSDGRRRAERTVHSLRPQACGGGDRKTNQIRNNEQDSFDFTGLHGCRRRIRRTGDRAGGEERRDRLGGGDGGALRLGHPPPADVGGGRGPRRNRPPAGGIGASAAHGTGSGAVRHGTRRDGLRRLGRRGRRHQPARHRRRVGGPDARADRRASAVHGAVRPSDRRRLPVDARRAGRGGARTGVGALRLERHGRGDQHRHPPAARGRRENRPERGLRLVEHLADRSSQPHPQRPLHERRDRLVQPHGRPPRRHGFRAVRRICQGRLRDQPPLERLRRCEPDTLQRLESGRNHRARLRQRLPHHARHGIRLTGKLVRPDFGRVEVLLQLGPSPDQ